MDLQSGQKLFEMYERFIKCPLCQKTLKVPKCLPCLHSFCLSCLNAHILTSERTTNSFHCPVCSDDCLAPSSTIHPEEWAKNLQSNQLIESVFDALEIKKGDRKCDPCRSTRKRSAAATWCTSCREALCAACTTSHQGMRLTRSHILIDINKIKSQPVAALIRDEKCSEHDDQVLVFYCRSHKQKCCPTCAIVNHRRCDNVVEMTKQGKDIRSQHKAERLLKRLNGCLETQRNIIMKRSETKQTMTSKKASIIAEVNDLKIKIIELLESMETNFLNEFDALHGIQETELQTVIEQGQSIEKAISSTITILDAANSLGSDSQVFLIMEKLQDECRKYEKMIIENRNAESRELVYTFKIDERLKLIANNVKKFGHLLIENEVTVRHNFKESPVRETAVFGTRVPFDDLRGVDIFQNGDIVIVDRMSKSVLLFHGNGEFVSHINFNSRPWGVAVMGMRKVCVSFPELKAIHVLKSTLCSLEEQYVVRTEISCFALTNFSGGYLAIQHSEEKDRKGRVTIAKSEAQTEHKAIIDITANNENIQGIAYGEATGNVFIAVDHESIECYNDRGRFLFRNSYPGYGDFHGMCVDHESNVYVASCAGKGILQISSDGERIRMISTSPLSPLDVAIAPRGNKMMAVGRSEMVHIFTFR